MRRLLLAIALLTSSPALAETITGAPKIVDGDTLDIGSTTIRLHGIDAPEVAQAGGREATNALARLVEHKTLVCEGSTRDEHKRLIAKCWIGNDDINATMVRDGYASSLEQTARRERRGIWRRASEPPWDYRAKRWHVEQQTSPNGCPIKGNITRHGKRVYHAPWSPWYRNTRIDESRGERWFCSEREALDAGWRAPYWH
jgi:endonuclease YncB( thermonuclease family)